jgi:acetyl-CoA C-acetyltransferase
MTVNRFCSSGLQTIALAAQRIIAGEADVFVAGGVESISCVQQEMNLHMLADPWLVKQKPEIYWNMLQTAEQVAKRYAISREAMDEYGAASQQKATAALEAGLFNAEIAPITVTMGCGRQGHGPDDQASHREPGRRHPRRHHHRGHPWPALRAARVA